MASASRELLAASGEVWEFLAEPYQLADWWPGIIGIEPDRRGFAVGARWRVVRRAPRGLLPVAGGGWQGRTRTATLVIVALEPCRLWSWQLVGRERGARLAGSLAVSIELVATTSDRTRVEIGVESRGWGGGDRVTSRSAVERLYSLVQPAAGL